MSDATTAPEGAAATAETAAPPQAKRQKDGDLELLRKYGGTELPDVFAMRDGANIIQEREPTFLCLADGFYGRGTHGTQYQEGEIVVVGRDFIPNEFLQPLNRAAGIGYARWLESLPANQAPIDIGDMSEASQMLAKNPQVTDLPPDDYQKAVVDLAVRLKLRRMGKDARILPSMSPHNFAAKSGGNAPPMLGAKMSDMTQRGPGFTTAQPAAATGPAGVRRAAAAPAVLGGQRPI